MESSELTLNGGETKINALCMKLQGRILPNHQVFVYSYTDKTLERLAKFSYLFYFIYMLSGPSLKYFFQSFYR